MHRKPLLAQIMYYSKDIESFGTGLRKIARECDAAGVRYGFDLGKLGFSVIFYRADIAPSDIGAIKNGTDGADGTDGGAVASATASLVLDAIKEDNPVADFLRNRCRLK
jgi:ATP-dependent DNA helicase RecG